MNPAEVFKSLVEKVPHIGYQQHSEDLLLHARLNQSALKKNLKFLPPPSSKKKASGIVISAGPSLYRKKSLQQIKHSGFQGTLIAVDGAYLACLKEGIIPDYVITLDPHKTRIVRWFGDPNFEEHMRHDDYYARQDLNIQFRNASVIQNQKNIEQVNTLGYLTKAIVCSSSPPNVIQRIKEAQFDIYGWNPLVDDPAEEKSITRQLYDINHFMCMNTGGTVGIAAWIFAETLLKLERIALVGMDFGYYQDTPISQTQTYYELMNFQGGRKNINHYFIGHIFSLTGEKFYLDPVYFWYRKNFFELFDQSDALTLNCTEGGTLEHPNLKNIYLKDFLNG